MAKLKEDFGYNLKLLEDRDAELDRCGGVGGGSRSVVGSNGRLQKREAISL